VGLAIEVMTTCLESPRSGQPAVKTGVERMPHVLDAAGLPFFEGLGFGRAVEAAHQR